MSDLKLSDFMAANILVHFDQDDRTWIAHCLELDLIGSGDNQINAIVDLFNVIVIQLKESVTDGTSYIQLAPKEYWERWQNAKPFSLIDELQKISPLPQNIVIKEFSQNVSC